MWPDHLPASVAFCDVETTGLGNHDRIVSFGGIGMIRRDVTVRRVLVPNRSAVFDNRWSPLEPFRASTAADQPLGGRSLRAPRRGSGKPN